MYIEAEMDDRMKRVIILNAVRNICIRISYYMHVYKYIDSDYFIYTDSHANSCKYLERTLLHKSIKKLYTVW